MEALIKKIEVAKSKLNESIDFKGFEEILAELTGTNDPLIISHLTQLFNDDFEYDEIMFSIIHSIETFDDDTYVDEIIKSLPKFWQNSPKWALIVHIRILNSFKTFDAYLKKIVLADKEKKDAVLEISNAILRRNIKFNEKVERLILSLTSS